MANPVNPLSTPPTGYPASTERLTKQKYPVVAFILGMLVVMATFTGYRVIAQNQAVPLKTISAGEIDITPLSAGPLAGGRRAEIKGSFTISTVPPGQQNPDAIPSLGIGGACLVADLSRFTQLALPQSCSSGTDCSNNLPAGWSAYCDKEQAGGPAAGKCWIRPGTPAELCNRSLDYNPPKKWPDGTHQAPKNPYQLPAPATIPLNPQDQAPVQWRVVACLSKATPAGDTGGCGGSDPNLRKLIFGKAKLVPYALQVGKP